MFSLEISSLRAFVTLSLFSLASILIHRCMQSVQDSARPASMADEEEVILGTTDESKAPNIKGPTAVPSTSKRNRPEKNTNEQEEDAPKKKKGGKQPYPNLVEFISHDKYNTVPRESK